MSFGLGRPVSSSTSSSAVPPQDQSAPWMAVAEGNLSVLQQSLQELQLKPDCADENGYTLLQAAASYGHVPIMEWLVLEQKVPLDATDKEGDTALHYATTVPAAQFLLQHCSSLFSMTNTANETALQAKRKELDEIVSDPDHEEDDDDLIQLKAAVSYLDSVISHAPQ